MGCRGTIAGRQPARLSQVLEFFVEDSQLNVYAGELEVRPPGAPTTELTECAWAGSNRGHATI